MPTTQKATSSILVEDKAIKVGGKQHILTNDNHMVPITINNGLPSVPSRPCDIQEQLSLPHVALTSHVDWYPTCLDSLGGVKNEIWYEAQAHIPQVPSDPTFNDHG